MKTNRKIAFLLAMALLLTAMPLVSAADTTPWYASDVDYVTERGLMDNAENGEFDPNTPALRGVIVEALWRAADRPAATNRGDYSDVSDTTMYFTAIDWATEAGVVNGYGNGRFGPEDKVTREQFAAMLWRAVEQPSAEQSLTFVDSASISDYAVTAVTWAVENGIVNGKPGNRFDPKGDVTRAEVAAMLHRYLSQDEKSGGNALVIYFSAADNDGIDAVASATRTSYEGVDYGAAQLAAKFIQDYTGADSFAIVTEDAYPAAYNAMADKAKAQRDNDEHPAIVGEIQNFEQYDTVFLVYPIWWYQMPMAMYSVFDEYDFTGKNILIATTHAGSRLAGALEDAREYEPGANVVENAFTVAARDVAEAKGDVESWLEETAAEWR